MFNNDFEVMSAYEVMDELGIGENSLYTLLGSGKLKAFRIGRVWKIPRKALDKYISESAGI